MRNRTVIFLGQMPPPYMGPAVASEIIMKSSLKEEFKLIHLDTSDHRPLSTLGAFDFQNIYLALRHYFTLLLLILKHWPSIVYIPICQTTIGYLRDAGFVLISKIFLRRVICHLRGGNFKNWHSSASFLTQWFVYLIQSVVDAQIVLGENLRYLFKGIMPREKVFVVPNGMDFEPCRQTEKDCDTLKVLFLSNFMREKGILEALRAIPAVHISNPRIEFLFAGNWHDAETKAEINKFLVENSNLPVKIIGPVHGKSKMDLLCASDIFVLPTYYPLEGHPWVIVEAMAAGLPIITTNQGAIAECVKDGINGFIVEKKSPGQIAEKILLLATNLDLKEKMAAESRRIYRENFTEEKMIKRLRYVFESVLAI